MKPVLVSLLLFLSFTSARAGDHRPAVFLTHFFVVLDQKSYDALRSSSEVAVLAAAQEQHVTAGKRSWTGFYVTGRHTYMEFFGLDAPPEGARLGDSGMGLTVEESGGVAAIAELLRTKFGDKVEVKTTPWTTDSGVIPWFTETDIQNNDPEAMSTWFMEVDPGFLAARHPGTRVDHPLSREQYLSWKFLPERPLDDVIGLTAALNPADMSELATELELVGWAVDRKGAGFVARGPDVTVVVVPSGSRAGIQQVELRLRHASPMKKIQLGTTQLILDGMNGRFIFWDSR